MSEQINGVLIISENTADAASTAPADTKNTSQCSTSAQDVLHGIQQVSTSIPSSVSMPNGYCITSPVTPLNSCTLPSSAQQSILCPPSSTPTTHADTNANAKDADTVSCTFSAHHEEVMFTSGRTCVTDLFVLTGNYQADGSYDYDMVVATSSRMPHVPTVLTTESGPVDVTVQHPTAAVVQHADIAPII